MMKILTYEKIPCWYELSFQKNKPGIILRIHKDFIAQSGPIKETALRVEDFTEHFKFKKFSGSFDGNIGFDDCFIRKGTIGDFTEFFVEIPQIKEYSKKKCRDCNGSGRDEMLDGNCFNCDGIGKEYFYNWKKAFRVSASFTVILGWLDLFEKETSSLLPQLMTVFTITRDEMHGGSLGGMYSIELCNWMRALYRQTGGPYEMTEMAEAMKITNKKIFIRIDEFDENYIWARIYDYAGWLNVGCPGSACGLHPANDYEPREGRGYEFACHNVDNPMQQFTLLAGLAALYDRARREIRN